MSTAIAIVICVLVGLSYADPPKRPIGQIDILITRILKAEPKDSKLGTVRDAKQCGGPSDFMQFRAENCEPTEICKLNANEDNLFGEIYFAAAKDTRVLELKVICEPDPEDGTPYAIYDRTFYQIDVQKSEKYKLDLVAQVGKVHKGKKASFKFHLTADGQPMLCVEAAFEFV